MNFTTAVKTCTSKYATFTGRALRSEFWYFQLFLVITTLILTGIDITFVGSDALFLPISDTFSLIMFLPALAVGARRLHDTGRSGWWQLLMFVPLVGWIILIVFFASKGSSGTNDFGPHPDPANPGDYANAYMEAREETTKSSIPRVDR